MWEKGETRIYTHKQVNGGDRLRYYSTPSVWMLSNPVDDPRSAVIRRNQ